MQRTRKRILIVERSRTIQTLLLTYFRNAGHQVILCTTSREALGILAGLSDAPDMIFLTIDPAREAYKVITSMKEHRAYNHTRLVAMILADEKVSIQASIPRTLSAICYLVKPFHIQDALALVSAPVPESAFSEHIWRTTGRENK